VPRGVSQAAGPAQQLLSFGTGQTATIPVSAGILAAVIEEPDVVVGLFQRNNLAFDEVVELPEIVDEFSRQRQVHCTNVLPGSNPRRIPV
jgi:hypothetical protein